MNDPLLTISLLITNAALLLVVFLLIDFRRANRRNFQHLDEHIAEEVHLVLTRLGKVADHTRAMELGLLDDGRKTRQRIGQVKTRLADEEKDDQRRKRRARRQGR